MQQQQCENQKLCKWLNLLYGYNNSQVYSSIAEISVRFRIRPSLVAKLSTAASIEDLKQIFNDEK